MSSAGAQLLVLDPNGLQRVVQGPLQVLRRMLHLRLDRVQVIGGVPLRGGELGADRVSGGGGNAGSGGAGDHDLHSKIRPP